MNTDVSAPLVNPLPLPVPLYEHIKQQVSEWILTGALAEGSVLPSEAALSAQFGVAVGTVRRALADLVAEGLVARRRKTGTVVTGRTPHSLRFFFHYFRLNPIDGGLVHSDTEVLHLGRSGADASEGATFGLDAGADLVRLRRLRRVDGAPVMIEDIAIPAARVPGFPTEQGEVPALLYLYLLRRHGLRVVAVREKLGAGLATAAERSALALEDPSAVLRIRSVAYDATGQPILLGVHAAETSRHEYLNEIR